LVGVDDELSQRLTIYDNQFNKGYDAAQYVVYNQDGLFLMGKKGFQIFDFETNQFRKILTDVARVEVSWNGFIMRNWDGEKILWADPDNNGNLELSGKITSTSGNIGGWEISPTSLTGGNVVLATGKARDDENGIFLTGSSSSAVTITYEGELYY